jgi:hypothetical protein
LIAASLTFLTPSGALLALFGAVPLAALAVASSRERRSRGVLGLRPPRRAPRAGRPLAVIAVAALLGLAASQPALKSASSVRVRTDAEVLYVIDTSRSMLAASAPGARTRITRARDDALALRDELADIPSGVATMTDRVLPDLLPVADRGAFDETVRQTVHVDTPPPDIEAVTATGLDSLGALGSQNFFPPSARHRVAIVFTDGESRPFDVNQTARALVQGRVTPIFVHVWAPGERIFDANGHPETAYHEDPTSAQTLAQLAQAARGQAFGEGDLTAAASAVRASLGRGPTRSGGSAVAIQTLAPYVALAALLPLLLLVAPTQASRLRGAGAWLRQRRTGESAPGRTRAAAEGAG